MPYQNRHAGNYADLLMRQGEIEAQRAQRSGDVWAGVARGVAGIPAGIQQRKAADRATQLARDQAESRLATDAIQRRNFQDQIDERGYKRMGTAAAEDEEKTAQQGVRWIAGILGATDDETRKQVYLDGRAALIAEGRLQPSEAPDFWPGMGWVKAQLIGHKIPEAAIKQFFPEPNLHNVPAGTSAIDQNNPKAGAVFTAPQKPPDAPAVGSFEDYVTTKYGTRPTPDQIEGARKVYNQADDRITINTGGDPPGGVAAPLDPDSQDLMSQAGLSYNGFLALTGKMSSLPRDKETRNRASAEVAAWARKRGMDVATLGSQYKAYNEALETNIARYNRVLLAEGEIGADVTNLITAAKESGLGDARAVNAAQQWLKGELNDPNAAQYAFFLNQLVNDIALYNSASQGRATLQSDVEDAKSVVRRGIASGSLTGMQKALTQSVQKMGTVLEGSVNRSRKNVWDLFGVGDKYKPKTSGPSAAGAAPKVGDTKTFPNGKKGRWDGTGWEPVE